MVKGKYKINRSQHKVKGDKCKEDHPPWVTEHTYNYCDKNQNTKNQKSMNKRIAQSKICRKRKWLRKLKLPQVKWNKKTQDHRSSPDEVTRDQQCTDKSSKDGGSLNIYFWWRRRPRYTSGCSTKLFDSIIRLLDAHTVNLGAKVASQFDCYTLFTCIIDSGG